MWVGNMLLKNKRAEYVLATSHASLPKERKIKRA